MAVINVSTRILSQEEMALAKFSQYYRVLLSLEDNYRQFESGLMAYLSDETLISHEEVRRNLEGLEQNFLDLNKLEANYRHFDIRLMMGVQDDIIYLETLLAQLDTVKAGGNAGQVWEKLNKISSQIDGLADAGIDAFFSKNREKEQRYRHSQIYWSVFIMGLSGFVLIVVLVDRLSVLRKTDQERREVIRLMEQRMAAITAAFDGICHCNDEGYITYANNSFAALYGYSSAEDLGGLFWKSLYDEEQCQWMEEEVFPSLRLEGTWHGHSIGRKKDGTTFFQDLSLSMLEDGGMVRVVRDVTEMMQTEALSKKRLAAIEAAGDGIGICDNEGRIIYLNRALIALHGISDNHAWSYKGQKWENLYDEKNRRKIHDKILPALRETGSWRGEAYLQRKDGGSVWAELSLSLLPDGGFIGTARDVTERKLAEEEREVLQQQFHQAQKMEAVGRLAGGIAHDFNNILAAIMGYAEFLAEDLGEYPKKRKYACNIVEAVVQARSLIDQIMTFSRRQESRKTAADISEVFDSTLDMIRASVPKTIEINANISEIDNSLVLINTTQIAQILMNLCVNAKDAMENGHGEITLELEEVEANEDMFEGMISDDPQDRKATQPLRIFDIEPGHTYLELGMLVRNQPYLLLSVSDTGTGMSRSIMEHIFEPFFSTKSVGKGTGLGLANVHGVVLEHGGALTVDSVLGKGTRFDIYLPVADVLKAEEETSEVEESGMPAMTEGKVRILVVEDQESVREMLITLLERSGYVCSCCSSGLEALQFLRKNPGVYQLVVTDHNMPKMTGLELAAQAQMEWPDLPFLLVTGYSRESLEDSAQSIANIKSILRKPVNKRQMESEIAAILGQTKVIAA